MNNVTSENEMLRKQEKEKRKKYLSRLKDLGMDIN